MYHRLTDRQRRRGKPGSGNPACRGGLTLARDELLEYRQPVMTSLATLSSRYPQLVAWDPFPVLCPQSPCRAVADDGPLFFDGDHLSNLGNQRLYPSFVSELSKVWDQHTRQELSRR